MAPHRARHAAPAQRVEAVRKLNEAGIACSVLIAPVLPGLSDRDEQVQAVARACADAGATSISPIGLHLRPGVREHYLGWLARARPDLLGRYRERFGRGWYQPEEEHRRLRALVDAAIEGARRRPAPRRPTGPGPQPAWRRAPGVTGHERSSGAPSDPVIGGEGPPRGDDGGRPGAV